MNPLHVLNVWLLLAADITIGVCEKTDTVIKRKKGKDIIFHYFVYNGDFVNFLLTSGRV